MKIIECFKVRKYLELIIFMFSIDTKTLFMFSQTKKKIFIQLNSNKNVSFIEEIFNYNYRRNILISVYYLIYLLKQETRIQSVSYDLFDFYLMRMKM